VKSRGWSSTSQSEEHWLSIAAILHTITGRDSMNILNRNFSHFPRWYSFCHVIIDFPSPPSCYQFRTTRSSDILPFASSILDDSRHCNIVLVSPIEDIESTVMEVAKGNFNGLQFAFASKCLIETTTLDYFSSNSYVLSI